MSKQYAIGVDLGGTNLRVGLLTAEGEVLEKIKEPSGGGEDLVASLKRNIEKLMRPGVKGIGIGVAGVIDRAAGKVVISPNLHQINGLDFNGLDFKVPVFVENDANAAALGEAKMGAGRKIRNFVLFTLGTGIGGGIVYEGRLMKVAAEVGHMSIKSDAEKCPCGNYGCLELYSSARAINAAMVHALEKGAESILRKFAGQGSFYRITPEDIYRAAMEEGDTLSREILKEAGRYLGVGIANIINILSPDAIILAGGLTGAWNIYIDEAVKEASKRAFKTFFQKTQIIPASLGDEAGLIGAGSLVFQEP
jgi:glucokinase